MALLHEYTANNHVIMLHVLLSRVINGTLGYNYHHLATLYFICLSAILLTELPMTEAYFDARATVHQFCYDM